MTQPSYHTPVLPHETMRNLVGDPDGIYIDGTLGGGGHAALILDKLSENGRLYGIDQDPEALAFSTERLGRDGRMTVLHGNFGYLDVLLPPEIKGRIQGILLDLGVSSHQIDEAGRGFSFQQNGPLDMRMGDLQTRTAAQIVNEYSFEDLRDLFYRNGEERQSSRIARAVIGRRPLDSTAELREAVVSVVPARFQNKSLARIFQALRIAVNSELEMLVRFLDIVPSLLAEKGRVVVISYHSLEDRLCKNFFRFGNVEGIPVKDFYGNPLAPLKEITRKVIVPGDEETAGNPRSRSARLRAAEKPIHPKSELNMPSAKGDRL